MSKDKKAGRKADKSFRAAALREFLVAMPGALERVTSSFRWLVLLGAVALAALLLHLAFGGKHQPPIRAENPVASLYVRDLGRVADGRHTFDLVYDVALPAAIGPHDHVEFSIDRLALGDGLPTGDIAEMGHAPGLFNDPAARHATSGIAWHVVTQRAVIAGACGPDAPARAALDAHHLIPPGPADCAGGLIGAREHQAHYRIVARVDQFADVAIGFGHQPPPRGWFGPHHDDVLRDATTVDEEVQLGAVLRAHCALGVKVQHGEMRSLCGS